MKRILPGALAVLLASGAMAAGPQPHWGYQGEHAPEHWAEMDPGFETCALGQMQSPIDIHDAHLADLPKIGFDYHAGPAEAVNNGHTIMVNLPDSGGIDIGGTHYALVQFHFHTPSEEKIDGEAYPMEAHFVHKDAEGHLAVVAVMLKEGSENAALEEIFDTLPAAEGDKHALGALDPAALLPTQRGYYAYTGSLTTPPCSEGVRWQVLKQPIEVSESQIEALRELYPANARPVQPLNGREVQESRS
ncbi:carbonic anhydrase [Pseudoxanthomonas sacheonensis]|uniref:carbonic anhydrase n=1 Tax=Pseudoxanthomonas sacheonensis TaxID=443615 RepID=A0ABU1RP94_9GAMM|nr:carbonic anhydrase family protein [Pseudoxanthomonas sacheonensis]MDR6840150.1 carbonic anhydrase [Pseudoxanthomonas sacheonensis]